MNRRRFLKRTLLASCGAVVTRANADPDIKKSGLRGSPGRILDTHIHLFDPTRLGGVLWPLPDDIIYKPALPARYKSLARSLGIVGAIAIEASPLQSDNDWLLRVVEASPMMVGMIGNLIPSAADFPAQLERLRRSPLFLGVRHGNLWNRSLSQDVRRPEFWMGLRQLSQASLVLESANPDLPLLAALVNVVEKMPELTVIIDHLPHMEQPATAQDQRDLARFLAELGKAPRVFAKLSEIPLQSHHLPVMDLALYHRRLDLLWEAFGPDKLMFGSDWPNSDHVAPLAETLRLVKQYLSEKDDRSREKFFFSNSKAAYRWRARHQDQF